ncbi:MAG: urea ABC transporter ATP-binding protein UrtD [Kiloniellales bacterium]
MSMLELTGVTKSFNEFVAVDNFDLSVEKGELRCLLGPNGAGKSTSIDLITGRLKLTSGSVKLDGQVISGLSEHRIARLGVGRKFQVPAVFKDLSVQDNLLVAATKVKSPFSNMFTFSSRVAGRQARFEQVVELIGLQDRMHVQAGILSHGETQWLEIGMVLMDDPRVMLMDEPTAGMTEQETHKTSELFNNLKGNHTLIVVEHDMSFVREIADIITVMHMGTNLAEGTIAEIENDPRVAEVYLGSEGIGDA